MYITKKYDSPQSQKLKITKLDDGVFEYEFSYDNCLLHNYIDENIMGEAIVKTNKSFKFIKQDKQ